MRKNSERAQLIAAAIIATLTLSAYIGAHAIWAYEARQSLSLVRDIDNASGSRCWLACGDI
jgi:hypothetical protein